VWCLGEFGDLLVAAPVVVKKHDPIAVSEDDVVSLLEKVLRNVVTEPKTKEFVLTALMKLTTRFHSNTEYGDSLPARPPARTHARTLQLHTHTHVAQAH
jgi:hypothetical protein